MRTVKPWMVVAFLVLIMVPCLAFGQIDPSKPPPCCDQDNPQPPPPGGNSLMLGMAMQDAMPVITISDTDLAAMGLTRNQFLGSLAILLFPDAGQNVDVVIPVLNPDPDPSAPASVVYYQSALGQVQPEMIDALNWLYLTDGNTSVAVIFVHDSSSSSN